MSLGQDRLRLALLDNTRPVPPGLSDGQGRPAGRRFAVYRNNIAVALTEALELSFPVIRQLIGSQNFKAMAGVFLRRHPPDTPIMARYGARLPGFLEGFEPLRHLPYLPDVARLEQALRVSYHAADAPPVVATALSDLAPDALSTARLDLAPAVQVLRSPWPVHAIWRFNAEDGPRPAPGAQDVLITRPGFDPVMTVLAPGAADFVTALRQGRDFGAAQDAAMDAAPEFDMARILTALLDGQAIIGITEGTGT